jgi:mRNA interferase RelE/StbE
MSYQIEFSKPATKQFKALPADIQRRLKPKINALATAPLPPGSVKLSGSIDLYRIRVGDYRVVYHIQDAALIVLVVKVGHRSTVYRE